jgi:Cof subfamily protein (haloacid dehalogenase superfamily)
MKYKLIAIDLDGTLLSPTGKVTPRTIEAIRGVLRAGLRVCFATGRNYTESRSVLDLVGHDDAAVFVGGAIVIDTQTHATLHRTLMSPNLAREVSQFFESHGQAVLALQDTAHAGVDYLITGKFKPNAATSKWIELTRATVQFPESLGDHPHDHTIRLGIVAPASETQPLVASLEEKFGPRIASHSISVPMFNVEVVEVFDPAVNKWQGILHVARRHNIAGEEIIAIGDDVNDLPMLKAAGLGVAMGNARPAVQAVAKKVIGHHGEEGLAIFLEELLAEILPSSGTPGEGKGGGRAPISSERKQGSDD